MRRQRQAHQPVDGNEQHVVGEKQALRGGHQPEVAVHEVKRVLVRVVVWLALLRQTQNVSADGNVSTNTSGFRRGRLILIGPAR